MRRLFLLLLLLPLVAAQEYKAEYVIDGRNVDVQVAASDIVPGAKFRLPVDASNLIVNAEHEVIELGEYDLLIVYNESVAFTYSSKLFVEQHSDNFFIIDTSYVRADDITITVKLPEGATLKYSVDSAQPSIIPRGARIDNDGKRIIVTWDESDFADSKAGLIMYKTPKSYGWIIALTALAIAAVAFAHYQKRSSQRTANLFAEEKLVVETLQKSGSLGIWQKELQAKTSLSKVKLSRKLRALEQKGVIEKIP